MSAERVWEKNSEHINKRPRSHLNTTPAVVIFETDSPCIIILKLYNILYYFNDVFSPIL